MSKVSLWEPIERYLRSTERTLDEALLEKTGERVCHAFKRQFMRQRRPRELNTEECHLYVTDASTPCTRKAAFKIRGVTGDGVEPRTRLKWFLGDLVEAGFLDLAELVGCPVGFRQQLIDFPLRGNEKIRVRGRTDDILALTDTSWWVVEVKSMTSRSFGRFVGTGPDDTWGYLTQASLYEWALREQGFPIDGTLWIAINTDTMHVAEWTTKMLQERVETALDRLEHALITQPEEIDREFTEVQEMKTRQKNKVKFQEATGRWLVPLVCSYCEHRPTCWPNAKLEMTGRHPAWVTRKEESAS